MSNISLLEKTESLIRTQEMSFASMAKIHGAVDFDREASFAMQVLKANPFLLKVATENPDSLKQAVLNVAAIGLSLSPVHKFAYLVPRDGKVMLDLSYKGLVQLAVEAKSVKFVKAELVYSKDKFVLRGSGQEPLHERSPFDSDRGDFVGAYCIAKTYSGEFIVDTMTVKEINAIRDRSQSYIAFKTGKARSCPWESDYGEMCKKTVTRRGSKSWPGTDTREESRFAKAIHVYDEVENVDLSKPALEAPNDDLSPRLIKIREMLTTLNRQESKFLGYLEGSNNREIKSLEELSLVEADTAIIFLKQLISAEEKKSKKVQSEIA